ncbi:hypothetical protein [Streptomyces zagrosensis]|uniref:Uncharacterized protein n=1 Tax=Streptomyces zagrosensis TaxID=1042984 RepID=A0A7W9V1I4_9ACTN|nr:hypothetical protein [Streptomyces zagrosensis]MBB5939240.1 hypothetical protein [Streptomyces zagrosensis]
MATHTRTPSFAKRAVRSAISSAVIADSCAFQAIRAVPSGEEAITSARRSPSWPPDFELGMVRGGAYGGGELQLQQLVLHRLPCQSAGG